MITLRTLKWSNCFSYGEDNTLQLDDSVVTQIIGTNGMGKSSIPLIIEEVLYNKNSKGIKKADIPNRYLKNGYSISLDFTKDDKSYNISVDRKTKVKVVLTEDGEDISSHTATNTYKTLQDIIGIDFKTFSQLVYQSTNASLQFLSATDTNRKKFLIDLLHLEEYLRLLEVFKVAHRDVSYVHTSISSSLEVIEKWLETNKLGSTITQPMLEFDIDTVEEEKEMRFLHKEIDNISEKNKAIIKNNQYKDLLSKIDITAQASEPTQSESYDSQQERLGTMQAVYRSAWDEVKKLNDLGDKCSTCEQPISSEFKDNLLVAAESEADQAKGEVSELKKEIERIKSHNKRVTDHKRVQQDWESLFRSVDRDLQSDLLDRDELDKRLLGVQNELRRAKERLGEVTEENQRRTKANTRVQVILEQTDSFIEEASGYKDQLALTSEAMSNLEVLKKAFSTNGILAYKIENLVKELEELGNTYLAELSDGRFTLEFIVSNDKLNVQITDDGNIVDITALSSGELARVNTATLIAIRKLMSSISKSRINVLFLDEVIAVLDDVGREKLVEVLLNEENLNTYIVSHEWEHPLLNKLNIVKRDDVSVVEA